MQQAYSIKLNEFKPPPQQKKKHNHTQSHQYKYIKN